MLQWFVAAVLACFKSRAQLIAENMCLRQQLVVLKRRQKRSLLNDSDRRFWILASRWFERWRGTLISLCNRRRFCVGTARAGRRIGGGVRDWVWEEGVVVFLQSCEHSFDAWPVRIDYGASNGSRPS